MKSLIVKIHRPERDIEDCPGLELGENSAMDSWILCRDESGTYLPIDRKWVESKIEEGLETGWDQIPEECLV